MTAPPDELGRGAGCLCETVSGGCADAAVTRNQQEEQHEDDQKHDSPPRVAAKRSHLQTTSRIVLSINSPAGESADQYTGTVVHCVV